MNVVRKDLKDRTAQIHVTIAEADYNAEVEKQLRDYKKKANIPGFRPGMAPIGMISKMYRKGVVADMAYRKATDGAFGYIKENNIETLGDLLPSEKQGELDFGHAKDFEFIFEIGLAPEVKLDLSQKDSVTKYTIRVDDEIRKGFRSNYMRRFGKLADVDVVADDEALTGTLTQGEDREIKEAYVGLISMDQEQRRPFIGRKVGDAVEVDVNEIYRSASQRASILGVKESELGDIDPKYTFTITQIRKFAEPELNDEFFRQAFPDGDVTDEKGFEAKIEEQVGTELGKESEFRFTQDVKNYLIGKTKLELPEDFLKRWLYMINEGKFTMEDIEKDFDTFLDMMRWDLIKREVMKENNIEIRPEDVRREARDMAMMQFQYYGIHTVQDDMLNNYADSIIQNKEEAQKIHDRVSERKVVEAVSGKIKVADKGVTTDEFRKLA